MKQTKLSCISLLTLFFSFQAYSSDSDEDQRNEDSIIIIDNQRNEDSIIIIEDPINESPFRKSFNSRELKKLQNALFVDESNNQSALALSVYPLSCQNNDISWDDLNVFGQQVDQRFFKSLSKKVVGAGIFCGLFGALVPYPSTGYVIYNVGNFLHIPVGDVASNLLITWIVTTTTPAFVQQSFDIGRRITSHLFHGDSFSPTPENDDSIPHVFQKSKTHYALKFILTASSFINAAIPTILMRESEKNFPIFFAVMVTPFYLAWLEDYYRVGSHNIDHLFDFYSYTSRTNNYKRKILKEKIQGFKKEIQKDDNLATKSYNLIETQIKNGFPNSEGNPFAFSNLFLRALARMSETEDGEGSPLVMNFKMDMEGYEQSWGDDLADWVSPLITGAGLYTKYYIYQTVLYGLMTEFGLSQQDAKIVSSSFAGFEALYRLLTSNYTQANYFKSFKNIFSSINNLTPLRKSIGFASFINASLFSLPTLVAGLNIFENYSVTSKIAYLAPSFLLDLSYYDSFFNRNMNEFITNISTIKKSEDMGIIRKRAFLHSYADKALHHIHQFDVETIEKLYQILQKGV